MGALCDLAVKSPGSMKKLAASVCPVIGMDRCKELGVNFVATCAMRTFVTPSIQDVSELAEDALCNACQNLSMIDNCDEKCEETFADLCHDVGDEPPYDCALLTNYAEEDQKELYDIMMKAGCELRSPCTEECDESLEDTLDLICSRH